MGEDEEEEDVDEEACPGHHVIGFVYEHVHYEVDQDSQKNSSHQKPEVKQVYC